MSVNSAFARARILVRGGGDLGSGAIYRLARAGFPVVVSELSAPIFVRRAVCFGEAVYSAQTTIEGVTARLATRETLDAVLTAGDVAVVVDPAGDVLRQGAWAAVVDARMEKQSLDTAIEDAPLVVALGPGYTAGVNCHAVIETNRGHDLGRVIWQGSAEPDTGEPGMMAGHTYSRVLRAPAEGHVQARYAIGDAVAQGAVIAEVAAQPVIAAFDGVLRGIIHERVLVSTGMKIGDLDPRARRQHCFTISDKSLSIGGGVLEAVLSAPQVRALLCG
jgi:xanthine dehydrogenase accessory factor